MKLGSGTVERVSPWSAVPWHRFGQSANKSAHSKKAPRSNCTTPEIVGSQAAAAAAIVCTSLQRPAGWDM